MKKATTVEIVWRGWGVFVSNKFYPSLYRTQADARREAKVITKVLGARVLPVVISTSRIAPPEVQRLAKVLAPLGRKLRGILKKKRQRTKRGKK